MSQHLADRHHEPNLVSVDPSHLGRRRSFEVGGHFEVVEDIGRAKRPGSDHAVTRKSEAA
jgi:hypothetical protein